MLILEMNKLRFFLYSVSSILVTALSFTVADTTNAQLSPIRFQPRPLVVSQVPTPSSGNQIVLNGRTLTGAWRQQPGTSGTVTYVSDGALRQLIGIDLLNTTNPELQPIDWFSQSSPTLKAIFSPGYRYLDISNFAQINGWQIQVNGNQLMISTPAAKINNLRLGKRPTGDRLVIDLDRPTPWRATPGQTIRKSPDPQNPSAVPPGSPNREWIITLDSTADSSLIQRYPPQPPTTTLNPNALIQKVETVNNQTNNQTRITLSVPFGSSPQITTLANPNRLVVDIIPDALVTKDITWTKGLRWQQRFINVGQDRFPVVWLEINPRQAGLTLKPITSNLESQTGIAPLIQTAQRDLAIAGINGGYFNRNNKLPLGAVRRDNQWLSGPILNRGAIAWNNNGEFYFGRLTLNETLNTSNNQTLPILFLNSAYVQNGIARYTPTWGQTYTPLLDNEIIITVQNNQITNQTPGGKAGVTSVTIPQNGYLLTLRGTATSNAAKLPIGTKVNITSSTNSANFNRYPHIIGAGPLLIQNRQIVLDAQSEKFSNAFIIERAARSAICTTSTGNLIIAAVHNRAGGPGPTLAEHAQLMQTMGCVNALNLDGGSSTSLYLGGQLLDRSPNTAARVHNGIGIFINNR
ncbi:phosphodiester glycosidase family protein [Sphaerospermopsis torques-reginae]|uniref:Phosphodiester glycosidase family protein n=1 Tax=Sphaerospermopsis torques-reginae ITEP-024 TaxID=984208 RepID=A0ABX8X3L0_9CYAN|nr:phosphodiester glycosidase family protein [Sphaerospermopsis torques-reginae]QYX33294.1 phosphodiester glycosidase family protein [Sphaerospermopsis torques-reginae ITEP-024]